MARLRIYNPVVFLVIGFLYQGCALSAGNPTEPMRGRPTKSGCLENQHFCPTKKRCIGKDEECPSCPKEHTFCENTGSCLTKPEKCPTKCQTGEFYCAFKDTCVKDKTTCRCPHGTRPCVSKKSCIGKDEKCPCPKEHTFCENTGSCLTKPEKCPTKCQTGEFYCAFKDTCVKDNTTCRCPHGTRACATKKSCIGKDEKCPCPKEHTFCENTGSCLTKSEKCPTKCQTGEFYCAFKDTCVKDNTTCRCPHGTRACATNKSCIGKDEKCPCPKEHTFCENTGSCLTKSEKCPTKCQTGEFYCAFKDTCVKDKTTCRCPHETRPCVSKKSCIGKDEKCPCPKEHTFCENTGSCLTKPEKCPTKCQTGEFYCAFKDTCVKDNTTCRCPHGTRACATKKSCIGKDEKCPCPKEHTFCENTGSCLTKSEKCPTKCQTGEFYCAFKDTCVKDNTTCRCPHGTRACATNKSCIGKDEKCPCPKEHTFCENTGSCLTKSEKCPTKCQTGEFYCAFKDTCVKDKTTCRCPHETRPCVSKKSCIGKDEKCPCPKEHTFCENTGSCLTKPEKCPTKCQTGEFYCAFKDTCVKDNTTCRCPHGTRPCVSKKSCIGKDEKCPCPKEHTFCENTGSCLTKPEKCPTKCQTGEFYCAFKDTCVKDNTTCRCPHGTRACATKKSCIGKDEKCPCPKEHTFCENTGSCLTKSEKCPTKCQTGEFYCAFNDTCVKDKTTCRCPHGTRPCVSKKSCIGKDEKCPCPKEHTFCENTGSCLTKSEKCPTKCQTGEFYCAFKDTCVKDKTTCRCPHETRACATKKSCIGKDEKCPCPKEHTFCENTGSCLTKSEKCPTKCQTGETYCAFKDTCVKDKTTCGCPHGKRVCATKKSCIGKDEKCPCPKEHTFCESTGSCLTKSEKCPKCQTGEFYCAFKDTCVKDKTECGSESGKNPWKKSDAGSPKKDDFFFLQPISAELPDKKNVGYALGYILKSLDFSEATVSGSLDNVGSWEIGKRIGKYRTTSWEDARKVLKISKTNMLRFKPKSIDAHGFDGIVLKIGDDLKYIGIIVMPCVLPKIMMKINSLDGTEETPLELILADIVDITREGSSKPNLIEKYNDVIPEKMLTDYKASLSKSLGENLGVVVRLSPEVGSIVEKSDKKPIDGRGLPMKKAKNIKSREPEKKVFYKGSTLVFRPAVDVKGMVKIQFIPVDVPTSIKYLKDVDDKCAIGQVPGILIVNIANVDDRPTVRRDPRQLNVPLLNIKAKLPLPYDLEKGNEGFKISDMARHACMDKDGDELGIAIVEATKSGVGEWQYLDSKKWTSIDVNENKIDDEAKIMGEHATLLFLTPDRMIRFQPVQKTKLWTRLEAMDHTVCRFVCWDQTNKLKDGKHAVTLKDDKAISKMVITITIERRGCDGKASSMKKLNECNECGKKSCKKCDGGGANSTAFLNKCGHCVLGNTSKGKDEGVNCKGTCGDRYVRYKQCHNICDVKLKKSRKDCAGKVCGTSRISRCKECSDGKDPDKGADRCGVCGGKDKCVGCDGKVKSGKVLDLCGECRSRDSSEFNTGCMRLGKVSPKTFPKGREQIIEIEGSGLPKDGIICNVVSSATKIKPTKVVSGGKSLKLSLPAIETAGEYEIACSIHDTMLNNSLTIFIYDNEELKVTKVEPADIDIGSNVIEVLVTGSGFMDTGEIFCFFDRESEKSRASSTRGNPRQVKTVKPQRNVGKRVNNTQVKCEVSKVSKAQRVKLSIGLSPNDHTTSSVQLTWYAKAPTAIKHSLNYRSKSIFITFDSAVKKLTKCEDLLDKDTITTLKELGEKPKCTFLQPDKLEITLKRDAIIKKGIKIKFKTDAIKSDGPFSRSSTPDITIEAPTQTLISVAIITAPRKVSFSRFAAVSGRNSYNTGGRRFKCAWWVGVDNENAASTKVKNDLAAIRVILKSTLEYVCAFKLSAQNLQPGIKYNVTLQVVNYMNETSKKTTHVIERSQGEQPTLELRTRLSTFDMSKPTFKIYVRAKKSSAIKSQVKFLWSCVSDTDLELKDNERNRLILRRDALECDRTYMFNVRAFMATNPKLASSLNVEITTKSATLKAKIVGGDRVIAANGVIKIKTLTRTKGTCGGELIHAYSCVDEDDFDCVVIGSDGTDVFLDLEGETGSTIVLKANQFQSNKTYTFKVIVSKEYKEVEDSVKIRIAPGSPPSVRFGTPKLNRKNPIITARIKTSAAKTEFEWECVDELGYGEVDIYDKRISGRVTGTILKNDKRRFTYMRVALVFKGGVLEPSVSYKFKLIAYSAHASDDIGEGVVTIKINAPPFEGNLLVTPQEGAAFNTMFSLTASGFYDDDVPLSYKFYYKKGNKRPRQLGDASDKTSVDVELPSGDTKDNKLTLLVQVKDSFGLATWSSVEIKVTPTEITADVLNKTIEETKQLLSVGDRFEAVSKISLLLVDTRGQSKEGENEELKSTLKETQSEIAAKFMEENKDARALKSMLPLLRDVEPQTEETKKSLSGAVKESINGQIPKRIIRDTEATSGTTGKGKSRRRRRSVEDESSSEEDESLELTTQELEDTLETFTNLIDTTVISNITKDFLQTVDNLLITMCSNLPVGETSLASSYLAVLKTDKNYMDNVDDTFLDVSCPNCSSMINHTALVKLGGELKDMYNEWNCTGGEELCNGVCLAMVQYPHDLITADDGETRCSDVIYIGLKNPETADYIPVNALTNHTVVRIPLHAGYSEHRQYECTIWDNSNAQWSTEECQKFQVISQNSTVYVDCNCSRLGFITVNVLPGQGIPGSELSTTPSSSAVSSSSSYGGTVRPTTASNNTGPNNTGSNTGSNNTGPNTGSNNTGSNTGSTTGPTTGPNTEAPLLTASVSFHFDVVYNSIVQDSSTKEELEQAIETKLADVMGVDVSMILNVTISNGSIYVNFIILSPITDPAISLNYSISRLEMSVNNGDFVVMTPGKVQIKADNGSVQYNYKLLSGVEPDSDDTKRTDKDDDNGSNLPIILGCVLGVIVLIVIVLAVVLYQRHLASKIKVSDSAQNIRSSHSLKSNCVENAGYQRTEEYNLDPRGSAGSGDVRQSAELPQVEEE